MANYGRGWDDGYGWQSAEAIDAYQERQEIEEKTMPEKKQHPSHKTRVAPDASSYDEICTLCGATDRTGGGWGALAEPCPEALSRQSLAESNHADVEKYDGIN